MDFSYYCWAVQLGVEILVTAPARQLHIFCWRRLNTLYYLTRMSEHKHPVWQLPLPVLNNYHNND